jgi:hypothetical protein
VTPLTEAEKSYIMKLATATHAVCLKWTPRGGCPQQYLYTAIFAHCGGQLSMENIDRFVGHMVKAEILAKKGDCYLAGDVKKEEQ